MRPLRKMIMHKVKSTLIITLLGFYHLNCLGIEEESYEIENSYPAEIRQNIINANSYQDFNKNAGIFLDQGVIVSQFGNKYVPILSSQFGVILNNSLSIFSGLQYSIIKSELDFEMNDETETYTMNHFSSFNAGVGYSFFGENFIHPKIRGTFGRGFFEIENEYDKNTYNYDYITPTVAAEINLWKYVTIEVGVQYRFIFQSSQKIANNNFEYMFHILIGNF